MYFNTSLAKMVFYIHAKLKGVWLKQGVIDDRMWWQPIGQSTNNIRQPDRKVRSISYAIKLKASTNFI